MEKKTEKDGERHKEKVLEPRRGIYIYKEVKI